MDSRATAARVLARLFNQKQNLDKVLYEFTGDLDDARENAFIRELCYGVLRWYHRLEFILDKLLDRPLKNKDLDIKALLLCGLYQYDFMRIPAHAAVSATVDASSALNKAWAKQLINALLRRYQREHESIQQLIKESITASYSHPGWFIKKLQHEWPNHWQKILPANNQHPPMHLRVNLGVINRDIYLEKLQTKHIEAVPAELVDSGITLFNPVDVSLLPGFTEGQVSVQDLGAQLAAPLLDVKPGQQVLDACAAPGGKTAHIYETMPKLGKLTAIESDPYRTKLLRQTKQRSGLDFDIVEADARKTADWWDGNVFDRILLDVPCSATGVIRRHPDIKLLRHHDSLPEYTVKQREILESLWPLLKDQGKLLYVSCSLLNEENNEQIRCFLDKHPDANSIELELSGGVKTEYGYQLFPGYGDTDGFFYALLEKM